MRNALGGRKTGAQIAYRAGWKTLEAGDMVPCIYRDRSALLPAAPWRYGALDLLPERSRLRCDHRTQSNQLVLMISIAASILQAPAVWPCCTAIEGDLYDEQDLARRTRKGVAVEPDHLLVHLDKGACIRLIFHTRDRGLRTQSCSGFEITLQRDLEAGIMPQGVSVISVFISSGNHDDPEADDVLQAVLNLDREPDPPCTEQDAVQDCLTLILAQQGHSGVRAHVCAIKYKQDWFAIQGKQTGLGARKDVHC